MCAVVAAGHKTVEPVGYCKATACVLTDVADEPGSTAAWPSTSGESGKASTKSVILLRYNGQNFLAIFSSVCYGPYDGEYFAKPSKSEVSAAYPGHSWHNIR